MSGTRGSSRKLEVSPVSPLRRTPVPPIGAPDLPSPTTPRRIGLRRPPALVAGGALAALVVSCVAAVDALADGRNGARLAATSHVVTQSSGSSTSAAPSESSGAPSTAAPSVTNPGTQPATPSAPPAAPPAPAPTAAAKPAPPASALRGPAASPGKIGIPAIPLAAYQRAASRLTGCGVPWWLLAGIGKVESNHAGGGRVDRNGTVRGAIYGPRLDGSMPGTSVIVDRDQGKLDGDPEFDRAVGPMQFLPGTWNWVKRDGNGDRIADPQNVYDAAYSAGVYLCRSGSFRDEAAMTRALWSYNASAAYARTVMSYATAYRDAAEPKPTPTVAPTAPAPTTATAPATPSAPPA